MKTLWAICWIRRWIAPREADAALIGMVISNGKPPIKKGRLDIVAESLGPVIDWPYSSEL